jgi:hypothetical protein
MYQRTVFPEPAVRMKFSSASSDVYGSLTRVTDVFRESIEQDSDLTIAIRRKPSLG